MSSSLRVTTRPSPIRYWLYPSQDKTIYVDDQVYVLSELEGVLRKKLEDYGEAPTVRLNADLNLNMEEVFAFLDIAKRNRYKVILGTRPSG